MSKIHTDDGWIIEIEQSGEFSVSAQLKTKFDKDNVNFENQDIRCLLDGIIFNSKELCQRGKEALWSKCILEMYKSNSHFFTELRGSFNGFVYDKKQNVCTIFEDQIGTRPLFYYADESIILVSSNFNLLYNALRKRKRKIELNELAVKYMLSFGGMLDNSTYICGVYRLLGGECLTLNIEQFTLKKEQYYDFNNITIKLTSESEMIEALDIAYAEAIRREFNKDKEYGYRSLVDISGGMDSRTVCFAAKKYGYNNILNICMSQMNARERKVAEKNVRLLGFDYVFTALDNGKFIEDIDTIVRLNYGLAYVGSVTGALKNIKMLDMDKIGIHHTGILGDIHDGSFVSADVHEPPDLNRDKYRMSYANKFDFSDFDISGFPNQELFLFKTRGILFGLTSNLIRQSVTETYSPFADVDFLNVYFSISLKDRVSGKILQKWVLNRYPEINKVVYSNTGVKLTTSIYLRKIKSLFRIITDRYIKKGLAVIKIPVDTSPKDSMNPFEFWYISNLEFRNYIDNYFKNNIELLNKYKNVRGFCENNFNTGKCIDKLLALTVVSVIKQYFSD